MTNKPLVVTVKNDSITINITQDTISVKPVYNINIDKEHHSDKLRNLTVEDLRSLKLAIESYITILS